MRALVTGGTGFVGSALVRQLMGQSAAVGVMTRSDTAPILQTTVFPMGSGPWSEDAIFRVIGTFRPDTIFHLIGGPQESIAALYEVNVLTGERLMSAAARGAPDARIVLVGSAAEYGPPARPDGVLAEDAPCRPLTAYGVAKLAQALNGLVRARAGQPITIARLFNPVGPGMPGGLAFSAIAQRLVAASDTLATGNLDVARDFLDVDEAARIVAQLARTSAAVGEIVNVCSGVAVPLRVGVERMVARMGRPIRLFSDPGLLRPGDPPCIVGGVRKLEAIGIRPASPEIGPVLDRLLDQCLRQARDLQAAGQKKRA